ncbi:zinc finger protein 704 isoform X3 [Electrophorus electricus]|uniref:zinc finger protein 704 isoform X3 n=1 Tax=Electrophorus electricus TaxID=8005 RepID=UPI0015CFF19A|nr:zinc finger protein 704 isoform X3 [Electrophorus electricus]
MTSKRLLDESAGGVRVSSAAVQAGNVALTGHCIRYGGGVTAMDCGITSARRKGPMTVDGFDTKMLDKGSLQDPGKANPLGGNHFASGREKHHNKKKMGCAGEEDEREVPPAVVLKRGSPTHRQTLNGQRQENHVHLECVALLRRSQEPRCRPPSRVADPSPDELHASSHIPVPRNRNPSGHADKEVMAATVLSTLSTSPLVLNASSGASGSVPEAASRGWKESLSASYSSSTSGNWSWDASDQSVPSTPSPPLSNDVIKSFLLSSQGEDSIEEAESTHFPFEDPIPRKRKNSMKVMFKCLWKNCDKVLSTSSGIQRHIRTMHLGRNGDSDLSDGEEDFYYSEIEVNVDTLSEGLSNLTPTSPTTAGPPPVFPLASDVPRSEPAHMSPLSQSAPSTLCHIRTDHAYQGAVTHIRTVSNGEKRQPATHTPIGKTHATNMSTPKPTTGTRYSLKPRGEAKKCRKVYGMEKKDLWCTACRWKKACQRFTD